MSKRSALIGVKEAIKIALDYLAALYEDKDLRDIFLEEVRRSDDDRYQLITLGFSRPVSTAPYLEAMGAESLKREFKTFEISAETGEVRSMHPASIGISSRPPLLVENDPSS